MREIISFFACRPTRECLHDPQPTSVIQTSTRAARSALPDRKDKINHTRITATDYAAETVLWPKLVPHYPEADLATDIR
jgi:hypothetical protein